MVSPTVIRSLMHCLCISGLAAAQTMSYSADIRPIFQKYGCISCHGGTNNLFLGTYAEVFTTGDHKPVVVPNDTNSVLILKIKGTAGFGSRMPQGGDPMAPADLAAIVQWVRNGAPEHPAAVRPLSGTGIPDQFRLDQNFPNPFNPSTEIRFALPAEGHVSLALYDLTGRRVRTLIDRAMDAGSYSYHLDAAGLSSGVYIYRLQSGPFVQVRKLTLMQ